MKMHKGIGDSSLTLGMTLQGVGYQGKKWRFADEYL